ncbi:MAG: permease [Spirochaetales bacterium]|uniref:Permease n=1 Tax=Candidatus Thalassospirochaeta sargassi TaxID=3119039 RepID=A0AAJ1IGR3_9SPIO|nr:permease [Spirochaetales bacterium]
MSCTFKKFKFIIAAIILYTIVFFLRNDIFTAALSFTGDFIIEMLQVLPPVLIITAMMSVWVPAETIKKGLGSASGFKGKIISLLIGSVSAGPIYAAFPATLMLYKKGASISNLVIILSSWAVIKVPMLLVETKFLGFKFTIIRLLFTIPAILLMSMATEKLVSRKMIINRDDKENEKITLPEMNCGACGCKNCAEFRRAVIDMERKIEECAFLNISAETDPA